MRRALWIVLPVAALGLLVLGLTTVGASRYVASSILPALAERYGTTIQVRDVSALPVGSSSRASG